MHHLKVDEIIDFVCLTDLNGDAVTLSAAVNGHIRNCEKCLKRVRAFQDIHDAFSQLITREEFAKHIHAAEPQGNSPDLRDLSR